MRWKKGEMDIGVMGCDRGYDIVGKSKVGKKTTRGDERKEKEGG